MKITRREFIQQSALASGTMLCSNTFIRCAEGKKKQPNVIYVFADQWRAQDAGFAGNKEVYTPHIDQLAAESLRFKFAISCMPVSTPYRGSFLTGQYAQTNGLFLNDVTLNPQANTIGKSYRAGGYNTAYIGKWHVNGNGRSRYIPKSHRQGFDYFKVLECTHTYNRSKYYDNNDEQVKIWDDYDVFAQTKDAEEYIRQHAGDERPFMLVLSWGPPHNPYDSAPEEYRNLYKDKEITLRPNVTDDCKEQAVKNIKGYYAHISAIDKCVGDLQKTIKDADMEENTIFVLTSDHGDMLGSQGQQRKQRPYDESIRVPFLLKYPKAFGKKGKTVETILNTPDIMPTLLSMSRLPVPDAVEGKNLYPVLCGKQEDFSEAALIECITPFGEWQRRNGGKEYRGVRTRRYTYVKDLTGPWLLYDNETDPYQMNNLIGNPGYADLQADLDALLMRILLENKDKFLPGEEYIKQWGYTVNKWGTVDYTE
ncbi:MAG: sulfatase [Tannerella sp.]|jgi:arylsulfatase A-like enzyme|nr:sulfatase [Tannerella sp.]